jgi:hypothetical protein
MTETSDSEIVFTRQPRIAQLAKQMPEKGLTSLNQHLDLACLREAYRRTCKDSAVGVDGQTAADYEKELEGNLRSLLERAKSGSYWAPPLRRVHIPKGTGGETRPIGIPTLEDKVLQRAAVMLLEPIYEQDFSDCSYGFRPRRSAHDALDSLSKQTMWSGIRKDPDVGYGRGAGGNQKGCKLHAVWGGGPMPIAWGLAPMNVSEKTMARHLIFTLPGGSYLLADSQYDAHPFTTWLPKWDSS